MERREEERKRKVKVEGTVLTFLLSAHAQTSEKDLWHEGKKATKYITYEKRFG